MHGPGSRHTGYQVVAIMGPQSSGKSTLMNHVFGRGSAYVLVSVPPLSSQLNFRAVAVSLLKASSIYHLNKKRRERNEKLRRRREMALQVELKGWIDCCYRKPLSKGSQDELRMQRTIVVRPLAQAPTSTR